MKENITEKEMLTKALAMTLEYWPCGDNSISASMGTDGKVIVWASYPSDKIKISKDEWEKSKNSL